MVKDTSTSVRTVFSPLASVRDMTAARKTHTHSIKYTITVVQPTVRPGVSLSHTHARTNACAHTLEIIHQKVKSSDVQLKIS